MTTLLATATTASLVGPVAEDPRRAIFIASVMLLTALLRRYAPVLKGLSPKAGPWIAIGVAVLGGAGEALNTGSAILQSVYSGIEAGVLAAGAWSTIGRWIPVSVKKVRESIAPPAPPPAK